MSIGLPVLATPYPAVNPLYDISGLLAPGVVPTRAGGPFAMWAQITPNTVTLAIRCNPSAIEDEAAGNLLTGLPPEFRPVVNTPDSALQGIFLMTDGRIWKRSYNETGWYLRDRNEVSCMFTAPRRAQ